MALQSSLNLWHHMRSSSYFLFQGEEKKQRIWCTFVTSWHQCVTSRLSFAAWNILGPGNDKNILSPEKNNNNISIHSLVHLLVRLHLGDCDRLFGWLNYMKYPLLTFVGSFNCNHFVLWQWSLSTFLLPQLWEMSLSWFNRRNTNPNMQNYETAIDWSRLCVPK